MIIKTACAVNIGFETVGVEVEVDISPGLPNITVVGLADKAVSEAKERVRTAIKETGFEFPLGKITINLAPAGIVKSGANLDLAITTAILQHIGAIKKINLEKSLFLGELSLSGEVKEVGGVLPILIWARENGFENVFISPKNRTEAQIIDKINCFEVKNLQVLVDHLNKKEELLPIKKISVEEKIKEENQNFTHDFKDILGQSLAKFGLEIAAAGGHNIIMIGSPGSGKTMMANAFKSILPSMTQEEVIAVSKIYSIAGVLPKNNLVYTRPFRSPHHTASHVSLVGGGSKIKPGEISLANRGVLFLDEFAEFKRETIEALRQPLEDGVVHISRANGTACYPANFILLAAANPSLGGDFENKNGSFLKNQRYLAKFSKPIMDRIDLQIRVEKVETKDLLQNGNAQSSEEIKKRVEKARKIQQKRFKGTDILENSKIPAKLIKKYCFLDEGGEKLMQNAIEKFDLSARSYHKIIKIARTIADLEGVENISKNHLAKALQFRSKNILE